MKLVSFQSGDNQFKQGAIAAIELVQLNSYNTLHRFKSPLPESLQRVRLCPLASKQSLTEWIQLLDRQLKVVLRDTERGGTTIRTFATVRRISNSAYRHVKSQTVTQTNHTAKLASLKVL
jgi:hypothetical protein